MELLELMKQRRSIRKYLDRKVEREKLEIIAEAGIYAPSPGGRQNAKIVMLQDPALIEKIGIVNASCENCSWSGNGVSVDQPSIIDDASIKSGFYGCPALAIVFSSYAAAKAVNGIGGAFVCAENMALQAYDLGVSSCIVGRAEDTFAHPEMKSLLHQWGLSDEDVPLVFVCLGYVDGAYPAPKERKPGRVIFAE